MKQVVDLQQIRIKRDTREPVLEGLPLLFGDMDKNALEEAVKIKEKHGATVTVLSVGTPKLKETVLEALAMGADQATLVIDPACDGSDPAATALILADAMKKLGNHDLILVGEGSSDNYSGQIGSRLAEALGLPQVTYVRELTVEGSKITATRDVENVLEVVQVSQPVIVSVTSEINKPRRAPLTQILRASRKPLTVWTLEDIGLALDKLTSFHRVISNLAPEQQRKGILFEGDLDEAVGKLADALRKEGAIP